MHVQRVLQKHDRTADFVFFFTCLCLRSAHFTLRFMSAECNRLPFLCLHARTSRMLTWRCTSSTESSLWSRTGPRSTSREQRWGPTAARDQQLLITVWPLKLLQLYKGCQHFKTTAHNNTGSHLADNISNFRPQLRSFSWAAYLHTVYNWNWSLICTISDQFYVQMSNQQSFAGFLPTHDSLFLMQSDVVAQRNEAHTCERREEEDAAWGRVWDVQLRSANQSSCSFLPASVLI